MTNTTTTKLDPIEEMLARGSAAHACTRAAKRYGLTLVGGTAEGTVSVTAEKTGRRWGYTMTRQGIDPKILAAGDEHTVAGALAKILIVEQVEAVAVAVA